MQSLLPLLLGVWSGSMIGQLAHHALGQYDLPLPLHGPPTQRFLVRNVEAFGEEWSLPADELRYALALREVVHGAQRSVPWVRDELERLATEYVGAYEVQPDALQEQLGELNLTDPSSMASLTQLGDPSALLGAMRSDRQGPLLEALQRFVSVLEGYTDIVVEMLGERDDHVARAHRRGAASATGSTAARRPRSSTACSASSSTAATTTRASRSAGASSSAAGSSSSTGCGPSTEMMPTRAEFEAPGLWLARIDL